MAILLDSSVTGNVTVTANLSAANVFIGGTRLPNNAYNIVSVFANSGSLQTASLNFVNTSSMTVSVGAGSTGNSNVSFVSSGGIKAPVVVTPSTNQNNYNPAGLANTGELRFNHTADMKITGISSQSDGFKLILNNATSDYLLWLEHESPSSSASNRFSLPQKFPAFLMPGDTLTLAYNTTISRWKVISWPNQGSAMGLSTFDDFLVGRIENSGTSIGTTFSPPARMGFYGTFGGGGGNGIANTTLGYSGANNRPMGTFAYNSGTSNAAMWGLTGLGTPRFVLGNNNPTLSVARFALPNTTPNVGEDFCVTSGFMQGVTNPTQARTAIWAYRTGGGIMTLFQEIQNTSSVIQSNAPTWQSSTNSPTIGDYIWHVVYVNSTATRATFIYSTDSTTFEIANSQQTSLVGSAWGWVPVFLRTVDTATPGGLNASPKYVHTDLVGFRNSGMVRG